MMKSDLGPFHHVGIAVRDLDEAVEAYARGYGAVPEAETFIDEHQQVRLRFMRLGGLRIELLQPLNEASHLKGLVKRGIGLYHICHEIDDLDAGLARLIANGVKVLSEPKPAVAFDNRRIAFTLCQGLMVELLETRET